MTDSTMHVTMPNWGMAMSEGTVVSWLVAEGDEVETGQIIAEVESTKIAGEVEASRNGIVRRIVVPVGGTVDVGVLLAVIADPGVSEPEIDEILNRFEVDVRIEEAGKDTNDRYIELDEARIAYSESNSHGKQPVVFVHGFLANRATWSAVASDLAQDYRVIALDLPAHGQSSKIVENAAMPALGEILAKFLEALELKDSVLVGHSFGAAVAAEAAALADDVLQRLVLISPLGMGEKASTEVLSTLLRATRPKKLIGALRQMVVDDALIPNAMAQDILTMRAMDGAQESLDRMFASAFRDNAQLVSINDAIERYGGPVSLVIGEKDEILSYGSTDCEVIERIDCGHLPQIEAPSAVIGALRAD